MRIASHVFVLGILFLAVPACSSSSGGSSPPPGNDAGADSGNGGAQACATEAQAICAARDRCSLNTFLNDYDYGGDTACVTRSQITCVNAFGAKGSGTTTATIAACTAAYPSYTCTNYFDGNPPTACVPPAGTLANGQPCGANAQCQSTFCATGAFAVCGTCQPLPAAGAACQVNADCGRDLDCVKPAGASTATMGVCTAYAASGAACLTYKTPCEAGLACVGDDTTTGATGTCQTAGTTVGAACDASRKTAPNCNADLGLVCIPAMKGSEVGTCKAITLAMQGAMCGYTGSAPVTGYVDCQEGVCQRPTNDAGVEALAGTCVALVSDTGACSLAAGSPGCITPAKCVPSSAGAMTGTCTVPNAASCM
jgi:hypothetical protein